ncbi:MULTISPECIES: HD domain-containing phosphohydrolase [Brevibacillus]|uniref:HD domain-containing phosphohydrolase n=1 Tax=Brevibacillus TaxID=55080 RepID=UPI000ED72863|nr:MULTISPECIES: HD domain-containing phosphohydrolase [Brevibacillus]MDH6353077.1 response regulator RpfG family c-di-GMP phosphodiesterase [Brevibacillus sp. 1238]MDR5002655.1 HD domain-containing protein [Brevibacillus parabrevis]MED2256966.1 HD domain-containing protein [Brevibacillus parabrevis]UED69231.1 HD domain-containing protein [Brevibacillus sp. HD3.3A]HBZ82574.1 c-di-GMP phosphodiesterase [Brevibacillus sp.]
MLLKLKDRLFATFLLLSLFPILLICFLFYQEAQKAVLEQYETSIGGHLDSVDRRLNTLFQTIQHDTNQLANDPVLRMTMPKSLENRLDPLAKSEWTAHQSKIRDAFDHFTYFRDLIGNVHFLRDDSQVISLRKEAGWDEKERPISLQKEPWGKGEGQIWLLNRSDEKGNPKALYFSQRVEDETKQSSGLLLVELKLDALANWLNKSSLPKYNNLMVVMPSGKILIHPDADRIGMNVSATPDQEILNKHLLGFEEETVFAATINSESVYAYHQTSAASGITYLEWLPGQDIANRLDRMKFILWCTICLVVIFSGYVAHRISRWIAKPIYTLVDATDALVKGDFSIRVPIEGMQEITFLEKKFNMMAEQMQSLIEREREYSQKGLDQIVRSFYLAVEMKDPYTAGHTERVTHYALIMYDHMTEKEQLEFTRDDLRYAGLMHDIGKVAIPDHVLLKNGKLTFDEYEFMKRHPSIGADIVEQIESLSHVSPGVRHHHERWDGKGYPHQLQGEEIPLIGRILAVADTFDAMTSTRSYRNAMSGKEAYEEIIRCKGTQFDPAIVAIFQEAYLSGAIQVTQSKDSCVILVKEKTATSIG